jgi:hypothetical protein
MTDFNLFLSHLLSQSGNNTVLLLVKYVSIDGIPQTFVFFRFVDIMDITVHDRFWNVDQAKKKDISKKVLFYLHGIYSIQTSLF